MDLGDFFIDERSRRSAVWRSLIRGRIYLLTGFFVAGAACVTLAGKHSGASSVLTSLASSAPARPAAEPAERTTQVATLAQPGVKVDHPPSDPMTATAPLPALEPVGSSPRPDNDTAGASSSDHQQPAKASAAAPPSKATKARAKLKAAARKQRSHGSYGGYGAGYGAGYVGGP